MSPVSSSGAVRAQGAASGPEPLAAGQTSPLAFYAKGEDLVLQPSDTLIPLLHIPPQREDTNVLEIRGQDGRELLVIGPPPDYTWTVAPEDAPEAARIFAECVSQMFGVLPAPSLR